MCHQSVLSFGKKYIYEEDIKNKKIIEIGSHNVNGSLKNTIIKYKPIQYIGIDLIKGKGVDLVCNIYDINKKFRKNYFDFVLCTEVLEHVRKWKEAIKSINSILSINGIMLLSTRSRGCKYHGYPYDYWRYEIFDIENIFTNYKILELYKDKSAINGVFAKLKKVNNNIIRLDNYQLYSIVKNKKINNLKIYEHCIFIIYYIIRKSLKRILPKRIKQFIHLYIKVNNQI